MNLKYHLRRAANQCVRAVPNALLRALLKSFETIPEKAERAGYNVYPKAFYSPFAQLDEIDWKRMHERRLLPGIELDPGAAADLLQKLRPFVPELRRYPYAKEASPFWFDNGSFMDFDAAVLYTMLRMLKPRRYIEVGCGFSSLVSSDALAANIAEGQNCEAIYIDPEPRLDIRKHIEFAELILQPVQKVALETFRSLKSGDVLFIDTSHVLKLQNDVEFELLRVLPSLQAGVWIHVHDVFTPYDYPEDWFRKPIRCTANEQYALECLLSGGDRFRVELPLFCLWKEQPDTLADFFASGRSCPQSFWIRKAR